MPEMMFVKTGPGLSLSHSGLVENWTDVKRGPKNSNAFKKDPLSREPGQQKELGLPSQAVNW
jgi:hypothetical protein